MDDTLIFDARARVLADLQARGHATPGAVSALEDAVSSRTWWAEQWPEGVVYVAGLVAQDVQVAAKSWVAAGIFSGVIFLFFFRPAKTSSFFSEI